MSGIIKLTTVPVKKFDKGHIAIYGQTMTGKTRYAQAILDHVLKPKHIHVFLGSDSTDWDDTTKYTIHRSWEERKDVLKKCLEVHQKGEDTVIVFDDFNESIHGNSDADYQKLFTSGRHIGIRVINMSQDMKGIAKGSREQIRYMVTTYTNNFNMIKSLSDNYLRDNTVLQSTMDSIRGTYNVILIDTRFGDILIDNASNYAPVSEVLNTDNIDTTISTKTGSNNNHNLQDNNPISTSVGARNIINNGAYNETSIINFQQNQEIQYQKTLNSWHQEKTEINYRHQRKMKRISERDELYDLLQKYMLSYDDKLRIIELLKSQCNLNCIDSSNWRHYAEKFMKHYYPEVNYKNSTDKSSQVMGFICENVDVIKNPNTVNLIDFAYSGAKKLAHNNKNTPGLIGNLINHTPIKYLTES